MTETCCSRWKLTRVTPTPPAHLLYVEERRIVTHPRATTGWDSLTDSELKVVNLIAEGATNRSVAERLDVTPHTVKAHLGNAFAKLEINSRTELSHLMRDINHPTN